MRLKNTYDQAIIEVISFTVTDIVTASSGNENIDTGSGNASGDGWTPIGW